MRLTAALHAAALSRRDPALAAEYPEQRADWSIDATWPLARAFLAREHSRDRRASRPFDDVGRVPRITPAYVKSLDSLGVLPGSVRARNVAATVREIAVAADLPIPGDVEGPLPAKVALRVDVAPPSRRTPRTPPTPLWRTVADYRGATPATVTRGRVAGLSLRPAPHGPYCVVTCSKQATYSVPLWDRPGEKVKQGSPKGLGTVPG